MATIVPRVYSKFRGVDFRGEDINLARSPDSLNVWKDYKKIESIRTRPGMENKVSFPDGVHGMFFFNGEMLVHSGTVLYKVTNGEASAVFEKMADAPSMGFAYENKFYIKDGKSYLQYDGTSVYYLASERTSNGYIPTTSIARKPAGGGTQHEDVNMLSEMRKNSFVADGKSVEFYLDTQSVDSINQVFIDGTSVKDWTGYNTEGKIVFKTAPPAPKTDGQANVVITFTKEVPGYRDAINKCTLLQVFDNRVFFSGNKDYPNTVWHCSLNDPSYISDTDYYREGLDSAQIRGMVAGNNALWVFREPSSANTTVFYHTPTIDDEYGKIYPSAHSSVTTGCIGKAINFNDDIVFFSDRGMEGISGDITTEQMVGHRSTMVDRKLIAEAGYKDMILEEWEGYLLVIIGNKVYLADSRSVFTNENHIEYEWFYWELEKDVSCSCVQDGILYLGTDDGVYTLTDMEKPIESYWVTPKDKFDNPHKLKTTNKRGCVAEATGDISVYAKLEDTGFEHIGTYMDVCDYFVSRIKRKKFKDIQLKFYSSTRFSLETVTLESFIGGYIKR